MTDTCRRMELALPHFAGLDLGVILDAQAKLQRGEYAGLTEFIGTLGKTGASRTIRKLAAIQGASDVELKLAEADPKVMADLEERAAEAPFSEAFRAATDFLSGFFTQLGVTPASSLAVEPPAKKHRKASGDSPSGG